MTNFINMGTSDNIQVKIVQPGEEVTPEMLQQTSMHHSTCFSERYACITFCT